MAEDDMELEGECYYQDAEDPYCYRCDNKGFVVACVDDLCCGAGECMHGDGEMICPDCKGESGEW